MSRFHQTWRNLLVAIVLVVASARLAVADEGIESIPPPPGSPNVNWNFPNSVAACPAGDSVLTGTPSRIRIVMQYTNLALEGKAHVPPDSMWVVPSTHSGTAVVNDQASLRGSDLVIYADDSTNVDGLTRFTISSLSGCGVLRLQLYVSGTLRKTADITVSTTDFNADGRTTDSDTLSSCSTGYINSQVVHAHKNHWHRNALFGTPVRLTNLPPPEDYDALGEGGISWNPDGKRVALSVHTSFGSNNCAVFYANSEPNDGSALHKLTFPTGTGEHDYDVTWAPDGKEIAWDRHDREVRRRGIPGLAADSSEIVVTNNNGLGGVGDIQPSYSPDGTMLAFARFNSVSSSFNIWTIPLLGGAAVRLTNESSYDSYPQWSNDGQWIYFDRTDSLTHQRTVYKVAATGGTPTAVYVPASGAVTVPGPAPDGAVIVCGLPSGDGQVTGTIEPGVASPSAIRNFDDESFVSTNGLFPRVSADGTRTAFIAVNQLWATRRNMNLPPSFSSIGGTEVLDSTPTVEKSVLETDEIEFAASASDPESNTITYKALALRTDLGFSMGSSSGVFAWTPPRSAGGATYAIRLQAETPSGGTDYAIVRIAVSDTTVPNRVTDLDVDLFSDAEVWPYWSAPGEDGTYGQCALYDVRYSTSTITSTNFSSATAATGVPSPTAHGGVDEFGITGLSPNTDYWFALKAKDTAGNWSAMSSVLHVKTLSGGGGLLAHQGGGEGATATGGTVLPRSKRTGGSAIASGGAVVESGDALVAAIHSEDGIPMWSIYYMDSSEAHSCFPSDSVVILVQTASQGGGWTTRRSIGTSVGSSRFALRAQRRPGRVLFRGDYTLLQAWSGVACEASGSSVVMDVDSAVRSGVGDVTASVDSTGQYVEGLSPGDTLTLHYAHSESSEATQDWFLLVGPVGGSTEAASLKRLERGGSEPGAGQELPARFALRQNQPNPFAGSTAIHFDLSVRSDVRLQVFDVQGRLVRTLADGWLGAGGHAVDWNGLDMNGRRVTIGLYFYRLAAGIWSAHRKLVVLK